MHRLRQTKHLLPLYPMTQMIRSIIYYRRFPLRNVPLLLIWLTKTIIFEPFRWIDAAVTMMLPDKDLAPVFVIGYYRNGTTYLQELLASHPRTHTMTLFDSVLPEVCLCFTWFFKPILFFVTKTTGAENKYHNIPFDWSFPGEEDVGMNAMGSFADYHKVYQFPSYSRQITEKYLLNMSPEDAAKWEADYLFLIRKLSYKAGKRCLILKSPPNTARVGRLKKLFPKAKFVFIHRDPLQGLVSAKRLWELNKSFTFEKYTEEESEIKIREQFLCFYEKYKSEGDLLMDARIRFDEFVTRPTETMRELYKALQLPDFEEGKESFERLISRRTKPIKKYPGIPEAFKTPEVERVRQELGYV